VFTVCYNSVSQCRCHVHHFKEGGVQGGQGGREVGERSGGEMQRGPRTGLTAGGEGGQHKGRALERTEALRHSFIK